VGHGTNRNHISVNGDRWEFVPSIPLTSSVVENGGPKMPGPERTKALFRCLFAYSNGGPVDVFDLEEIYELGEKILVATAAGGNPLKVAVVGDTSALDFDATEWPELLAAAYDMFVDNGNVARKPIEWVRWEQQSSDE